MNAVPQTPFAGMLPIDTVLPLVFYLIALVYIIFTAILYYHWQAYSANPRMNFLTYATYFALSLPTILILAGATVI